MSSSDEKKSPRSGWRWSSAERGGYGKQWRKLRKVVLERDQYLCQCVYCKQSGSPRLASEVDHVVSKAKAIMLGWSQSSIDALSNLQAINKDCHERKTREEKGHTYYGPRPTIGADGYPVAG